jgi:branched-chain amino acid transport system ATP-binding protein
MNELTISDLHVDRSGRPVLHGVDLHVRPGAITTLLGPNGAGKSTLVLALGGLIPVRDGTVAIAETKLQNRSPERIRRAGLAIVPEGRWLLRGLTVEDNMNVATYALGRRAGAGIERVKALFPELEKRWHHKASLLSGGEQQMLALAQALATDPSMLVVDELSLGLAPIVVKRLVPVLQTVASGGVGVLLIEQFADVALRAADSAYVIEGGRIRFEGPTEKLIANPALLSAAYLADGSAAGPTPVRS